MVTTSRHDAWAAGDSYDVYMGRWSRPIAARFLDWLALPDDLDWLDLGCGTRALTAAIIRQCAPASIIAMDPSEGFIAKAREDFWHQFTLGAGPAPGYCVNLSAEARQRLKERLSDSLQRQDDGSIALNTRAWAVKARVH